jgi:hypothetical protein
VLPRQSDHPKVLPNYRLRQGPERHRAYSNRRLPAGRPAEAVVVVAEHRILELYCPNSHHLRLLPVYSMRHHRGRRLEEFPMNRPELAADLSRSAKPIL